MKGDILAHERVELGATARVTGNVYYALIEMEIGAEINGKPIHEPGRPVKARKEPRGAAADRRRRRPSSCSRLHLIPARSVPMMTP